MLNRAPIFINGFNRGGTNLLQFLMNAHPDVCLLGGETHELFYGKSNQPIKKWFDRLMTIPIVVTTRQHTFYVRNFDNKNPIPGLTAKYIDWLMYRSKMNSIMNRSKDYMGTPYTKDEVRNSRILCKNTNGVVLVSKEFQRMYPDARFIAMVRNGLALCEGYTRRGWTIQDCAKMYERVCQQIIHDSKVLRNYNIVKFENMMDDPISFVKKVYEYANLDISQVAKFGMKVKLSTTKSGERELIAGKKEGDRVWLAIEELGSFFRKDVNTNQMDQMKPENKEEFLKFAGDSMKHFGYI